MIAVLLYWSSFFFFLQLSIWSIVVNVSGAHENNIFCYQVQYAISANYIKVVYSFVQLLFSSLNDFLSTVLSRTSRGILTFPTAIVDLYISLFSYMNSFYMFLCWVYFFVWFMQLSYQVPFNMFLYSFLLFSLTGGLSILLFYYCFSPTN